MKNFLTESIITSILNFQVDKKTLTYFVANHKIKKSVIMNLLNVEQFYRCCYITATLDQLLQQENLVIEYWTVKKKKLEQCHQYVLFEQSAKQVRVTSL